MRYIPFWDLVADKLHERRLSLANAVRKLRELPLVEHPTFELTMPPRFRKEPRWHPYDVILRNSLYSLGLKAELPFPNSFICADVQVQSPMEASAIFQTRFRGALNLARRIHAEGVFQNNLGTADCLYRQSRYTAGVIIKHCFPWLRVVHACLLYTSPSPRDRQKSRMPSSA